MTSKHPTIYDVAEAAGVSIGTVSKSLNKPDQVSAATRQRVLDAVHSLQFVPKSEATSRARRGVGRIGVMAPFTSYPSFYERLNGVFDVATVEPVEVVVYDFDSPAESASLLEALPATRSLDGLIIMLLPFAESIAERLLAGRGPEAVLIELEQRGFSSVAIDDEQGGRLAGARLLAAGHERVGFVGHRQRRDELESPARRRLAGLRSALAGEGRVVREDDIVLVGLSFAEAKDSVRALLLRPDRPTALFAHSDQLAAAIVAASHDLGLRVPEDVAVLGFDDSPLAEALDLTTIRQPLRESGAWAARQLLDQLRTPSAAVSVRMGVELVERGSV